MSHQTLEQSLLELLKIDSVVNDEEEISGYLARLLDPLPGFNTVKTGLSHIWYTEPDPNKKTIAFYGHMDTVTNQQDRSPYQTDERIYGCGASDMKGGLAVMIELMHQYSKTLSCEYNLTFVFYDKEEGPYDLNGLGPVLEENPFLRQCDLAFVLEPTNNVIQMGCVGGLHAKVQFLGKSAHSARPWEGENAIHKAGTFLTRLQNLERKEVSFHGLNYYEVINATLAIAGNSRNSIPACFELNVNYRFAPGKSVETAKKELLELIGKDAEVTIVDECPSADVVVGNSILDRFSEKYQLECEPKQAWTDIARLGLYDIPAVNCGPGDPAQAHQKNEWIDIQSLRQGLRYYSDFLFS